MRGNELSHSSAQTHQPRPLEGISLCSGPKLRNTSPDYKILNLNLVNQRGLHLGLQVF